MIVFPNGKINLGLRILGKRRDGFHDIESYMVPIGLSDILEIVPAGEGFSFDSTGLPINVDEEQNLCVKAFRLLERTYNIAPVRIHLHKIIPMGSGLGGGSSDAAFTLALLRRLFNLRFCNSELEILAGMLGSDCPFFVVNKTQMVTRRGEPSHKFLKVPHHHVVVVIPPIPVSTSWAYGKVKPSGLSMPLPEELIGHEDRWRDMLVNDFELPVFEKYPLLADIKEKLYGHGAFYASMSGSGSAIYGLFKQKPDCKSSFNDMFFWQGLLGEVSK